MKYHISLKFIAVLLCTLTLMAALAAGGGLLVLLEGDLYSRTPEEIRQEQLDARASTAATCIAKYYAVQNLSDCPQELLEAYFEYLPGEIDWLSSGYRIQDSTGKVLENAASDSSAVQIVTVKTSAEYPMLSDSEQGDLYQVWDEAKEDFDSYYVLNRTSPVYTISVAINPNILPGDGEMALLQLLWQNRNLIPALLVLFLLLFAVCAVYLCCAAGHTPESAEIKPAGLNALPLDLYGFGAGMCFVFTVLMLDELGYQSLPVMAAAIIGMGFVSCLVFVGFCFACAAQFKMPGAYWLRHTAVGWAFLLAVRILKKLIPGLWWIVKALWHLCIGILRWCWNSIKKIFGRFKRWCVHIYSLLPYSWQWILAGGGIMLGTFLAFAVHWDSGFLTLLLLAACAAVIFYAANAFGILMRTAEKMSQGNLGIKVDSPRLVGCFRDFGAHLNDLSDVAATAASNQMRAERMRTELITNVSHDIKTPLTSIINYVDLLQKAETPQQTQEYLQVLDRQSQRLKKLIEDLMEMSKASTGNLPVNLTPVDAKEAIHQALGEFADKLALAKLEQVLQLPEERVYAQADGRLLWRVLSNLIGNTVKYAQGGTRFYISLSRREDTVQIELKNISRESLNISADELMERFVRGDASRNTEGSGLGLNIAKSLMELQHGSLNLTVDGDLFKATLTLPAAQ